MRWGQQRRPGRRRPPCPPARTSNSPLSFSQPPRAPPARLKLSEVAHVREWLACAPVHGQPPPRRTAASVGPRNRPQTLPFAAGPPESSSKSPQLSVGRPGTALASSARRERKTMSPRRVLPGTTPHSSTRTCQTDSHTESCRDLVTVHRTERTPNRALHPEQLRVSGSPQGDPTHTRSTAGGRERLQRPSAPRAGHPPLTAGCAWAPRVRWHGRRHLHRRKQRRDRCRLLHRLRTLSVASGQHCGCEAAIPVNAHRSMATGECATPKSSCQ